MSEITSTHSITGNAPTGFSTVTEVGTQGTAGISTSTGVRVGGGYFVMASLTGLGLPAPNAPKDIIAYLDALWRRVEEQLAEMKKNEQIAESEMIESMLGRYGWLLAEGPELESQKSEKETAIDSRNDELTSLRSERNELLAERSSLDTRIEEADSASERDELVAERNRVDEQLSEVLDEIALLEGEISTLTDEVAEIDETLSQIDTAFLVLLSAIMRERNPVVIDTQSGENSRIERSEERMSEMRDHAIELNLSHIRQQEVLDAIQELQVRLEQNEELALRLSLTSLQAVLGQLPIQSNGGMLPKLSGPETDGGGRFRLPI